MDLNQEVQEVTVDPPLKKFGHYLSVGLALLVFGYLIFISPLARDNKSRPTKRPAVDSGVNNATAGQPPNETRLLVNNFQSSDYTFDEDIPEAVLAEWQAE